MTKAVKDPGNHNIPAIFSNFKYEENFESIIFNSLKTRLFQKLTSNSCPLFLRAKDDISISPQTVGIYEPALTKLINGFAINGYSGFFLDIGANIGLTSCQNGNSFEVVHMFEPNPLCCQILNVNATITLDTSRFTIHQFGLGDCDKIVNLTVPKHNWGGAFINDAANSYDARTLAAKDSFERLEAENYFDIAISIKNTATQLQSLFSELASKKLLSGVIKIDAEGYEPVILKGIAESIPKDIKCLIVFESWDPNLVIEDILAGFKGRASAYRLTSVPAWKKHRLKLIKIFSLFFNRQLVTKIEKVTAGNCGGDIILEVTETASI